MVGDERMRGSPQSLNINVNPKTKLLIFDDLTR